MNLSAFDQRIADVCKREGLITGWQLESAAKEAENLGKGLGYVLVFKGILREEAYLRPLARLIQVPPLDVENIRVKWRAIREIPRELALKHLALPVHRFRQNLDVAMVNPLDQSAIRELQMATLLEIQVRLAGEYSLRNALYEYYPEEGDYRESCLFIGPSNERSEEIVKEVIRPALEDNYSLRRFFWDAAPTGLSRYEVTELRDADLIVADLTSLDPRVFYLLGIQHCLGKPTILISEGQREIPFEEMARHVMELPGASDKLGEAIRMIQDAEEEVVHHSDIGNPYRTAWNEEIQIIE